MQRETITISGISTKQKLGEVTQARLKNIFHLARALEREGYETILMYCDQASVNMMALIVAAIFRDREAMTDCRESMKQTIEMIQEMAEGIFNDSMRKNNDI